MYSTGRGVKMKRSVRYGGAKSLTAQECGAESWTGYVGEE